jgi:hypothetical protein
MKNVAPLTPLPLRTDRPPSAQITPSRLVQFHTVERGGGLNAVPGGIPFGIGHTLHLVEARHSVSHMTGVFKGLFALRGKGELAPGDGVALL